MDILTKVSLWLIALALWGLLLRPLFLPTPLEGAKPMEVKIVGIERRIDVNIDAVADNTLRRGAPLPVSVK